MNDKITVKYTGDPATANGCCGLFCNICGKHLIFDPVENETDLDFGQESEVNWVNQHEHRVNPEINGLPHIEPIFPQTI